MFGELVPQGGGDPVPLLRKKLLIGRRDSCDIALRFPNVSSRHCELEMVDHYWMVRDLGSSNGTKVNGVRVRAKWLLPGDELSVAKHRYKVDYDLAPDTPPPPPIEEEEDVGTSLLEKAGLVRRRSARPDDSTAENGRKSNGTRPGARSEEDQALEWLQDGDDE